MNLLPPTASEWAQRLDLLNGYVFGWLLFFTVIIFLGVFVFAIAYRRRSPDERPKPILGSIPLEALWAFVPLMIGLSMFAWGAQLYFDYASPPVAATEMFVTGRQWMFWTQHPEGVREINELHVPLGRPVKLTMSSEDVIHSFFIPAFRIKHDLVPGRYTSMWFTPTRTGKFRLFCAEYCGTQHSGMIGWVYVLDPPEFEAWLAGGASESLAEQGQALFARLGCSSCHNLQGQGRCPNLRGVYGTTEKLQDGTAVLVDDSYVRNSILNPGAQVVAGFQNIMPSYQGQLSEQNILQLIAYVRSLGAQTARPGAAPAGGQAGGVGLPDQTGAEPNLQDDRFRRLRAPR